MQDYNTITGVRRRRRDSWQASEFHPRRLPSHTLKFLLSRFPACSVCTWGQSHRSPDDGDSGIIYLQAKDDPEDEYPSKLYKFLDDNEEGAFYISVEEGDVLSTPYRISLTISAGLMFE